MKLCEIVASLMSKNRNEGFDGSQKTRLLVEYAKYNRDNTPIRFVNFLVEILNYTPTDAIQIEKWIVDDEN